MPARIVTSTYRYKRPPRKQKAVLLEVPAIVTPKPKAAPAIVQQDVKPGNDNRPEPARNRASCRPRSRSAGARSGPTTARRPRRRSRP